METVQEPKPHYNVVIATPGKEMHQDYVKSLIETTAWLNEQGLTYKWINKSGSLVSTTRELTALDSFDPNWDTREVGSGKFTYDKVFWIDSDISWTLDNFRTILESELDIVGGLYQTAPDGRVAVARFDQTYPELPTVVREQDFIFEEERFIEVYGLGFGFIAMKQGVFEACSRPWFYMRSVRWPHLDFDTNLGEDYSFCVNAREAGFKTYLDLQVKVKHHKEIVYELR